MNKKLSLGLKLGYGVGDLGGNLFFTIIGFHLYFYLIQVVHLQPLLAGLAIALGKAWDAVTDPVMGYISDRTRSRWGRRRPYIFAGGVLLFIFMIFMFHNHKISGQIFQFVWAVSFFCALSTAFTLVTIPYSALTPELTEDFDERTRLNGYRMAFALAGTMLGAASPIVAGLFSPQQDIWPGLGISMGFIMMAASLTTVFSVREPEREIAKPRENILKAYWLALANRPFLLALFPWTFFLTGIAFIQANLILYFKFIYNRESLAFAALFLLLLVAVLTIPLWVFIAGRIGKKLSYNIGMGIMAAVILVFFFLAEPLGPDFAVLCMVLAGLGLATNYVMPYSIVPDVIEYDCLLTGERREGVFYALWNFTLKFGQALAFFITGALQSALGFNSETTTVENITEPAKMSFKLVCGPFPVFFIILGIIILSFYPINRQFYNEIKARIAEKEKQ